MYLLTSVIRLSKKKRFFFSKTLDAISNLKNTMFKPTQLILMHRINVSEIKTEKK